MLTGSKYGAPLESGSNVGDALISTDASDGGALLPMTCASVAGTSIGEDDGVSTSAGGTSVDASVGADVVSAGRDHGPSCDSREPSALMNSSRRLHAVKEDASKQAVPTSPPVDDRFLSQMELEYSWLSSALEPVGYPTVRCLDKAGVGAKKGVPVGGEAEPEADVVCLWSKLQRVTGANVGEDGVGRHSKIRKQHQRWRRQRGRRQW